jgi:hypothetical protein
VEEKKKSAFYLVGRPGLEPGTLGLKDASDLEIDCFEI